MTYRNMSNLTRRRIENRLERLFKAYGTDAETVANRMIQRRRTERRNRRKISDLQRQIENLK